MHDGLSLFQTLQDTIADCNNAIAQLMNDGVAVAAARQKYRVALARKQLELRETEKLPATLINDVSRGDRGMRCSQVRFGAVRGGLRGYEAANHAAKARSGHYPRADKPRVFREGDAWIRRHCR